MDIKSVMTPNPATCTQQTPLRDVARMMVQHDCGQIPVIDESNRPIGVVTDRDIAIRIVAEGRDPATATAADCMSTPATTIPFNASLTDACDVMETAQIRRVLVVDEQGKIAGIVAQADIALTGRDRATADVVEKVSKPMH